METCGRAIPNTLGVVRALLIANANDADPGFVGERFRAHGFVFTDCHRERPADWPELPGHDLIVQLGSDWSAYWPDVATCITAEKAVLLDAARRGIPVFAICFGAQVMAQAFGGSVRLSETPEIGWYHFESDVPEIAAGPWMQWHYDVFAVPPGADEVARSAVGPQAFIIGRMFATQFHPEVDEPIARRWCLGAPEELAAVGTSPDALIGESRRTTVISERHTAALVDWFCEAISAGPMVR